MADDQTATAQGNTAAAATKTEQTQQDPVKGDEGQAAAAASSSTADKTKVTPPAEPAKKEDPKPAPTELKLELPEGSKLAKADVDKIASFAKDHGLSQDAAAALLKRESEAVVERETVALGQLKEQSETWKQEIIDDKEFGGSTEKAQETAQMAYEFAKKFGDEHFVTELERTGLGNHPGLVKLFARAGRAMAPDTFKGGGTSAGANKKSMESKFYAETTPV